MAIMAMTMSKAVGVVVDDETDDDGGQQWPGSSHLCSVFR